MRVPSVSGWREADVGRSLTPRPHGSAAELLACADESRADLVVVGACGTTASSVESSGVSRPRSSAMGGTPSSSFPRCSPP